MNPRGPDKNGAGVSVGVGSPEFTSGLVTPGVCLAAGGVCELTGMPEPGNGDIGQSQRG